MAALTAAAAALAVGGWLAAGPIIAAIGSPDDSGPSQSVIASQETLHALAERITGPGYEEGKGREGLGGVVLDPDNATLTVAWKGSLPPDVEQIIKNAPSGVTVRVIEAKYTRADMWAATTRVNALAEELERDGWRIAPQIDPQGQYLSVGMESVEGSSHVPDEAAEDRVKAAAGIDVHFTNDVPHDVPAPAIERVE